MTDPETLRTNGQGPDWESESRELSLTCDAKGRVLDADARARKALGAHPGQDFLSLAADGTADKLTKLLELARVDIVRDWEVPLVHGDRAFTYSFVGLPGANGSVHLLGTRLSDKHGNAMQQLSDAMSEVVELNRQISRQKRELQAQKEELERAYRELDESNRGVITLHAELADKADSLKRTADVRGRLVANVSHEFRTPLHTILGLSKLLLDAVDGPLTLEQQKQIGFIRSSAEELSQLVNDLLDLSKAEAGKIGLRTDTFTMVDFLSAMRGMLRPLVSPADGVELVFENPKEELLLETDQGKVAQIVRNLVSNALKFTEKGEVRVTVAHEGADVVLQVKDTGIGIAPENFERVFEEFGQIESHIQRRVKGTGLGLPLSRRLAQLLGGSLTLESELGKGSTFTLRFPALHPEVAELASIKERPLDPTLAPVLVVEDDRRTIFIYEKYLSMAGFQVVPARTVEEARRIIRQTRPAAVVLDIMLEGEATWDLLAELKREKSTADIPVLVVTVTSKEQKARALGADEFWLKPIDQDRLIKKLKQVTKPGMPTKLLVIDDDERSRYLVKKLLEKTPYAVSEASSGPEGVQLASELKPNVIFLDFLLRDVTAFDVLDELKANPQTRGIPVIVITSHLLDPAERKRLAAETEAILSKENLSRELAINRIRDALRKAGVGTAENRTGER